MNFLFSIFFLEDRQFPKNIWSFNVTLNFGDKSSEIQPIKLTCLLFHFFDFDFFFFFCNPIFSKIDDFKFLSPEKLNGTEINGGKSTKSIQFEKYFVVDLIILFFQL